MKETQATRIKIIDCQQAIDAIEEASDKTTIILDFDETLFLRNSTAEYIDSLRPRLIGYILLLLLRLCRPWAWLPKPFRGDKIRDWFLVVIPTIIMPWTLWLWQRKARALAEDYGNTELIQAVNNNADSPIIIASLGFNFIIHPILHHIPMRRDRLIGCKFWQGARDRGKGKLLMMQEALSESAIKSAIVVTDSEDDLPLLQVVAKPYLVIWSLAKYRSPFKDYWLSSLVRKVKNN